MGDRGKPGQSKSRSDLCCYRVVTLADEDRSSTATSSPVTGSAMDEHSIDGSTVLVVDDDTSLRAAVKELLESRRTQGHPFRVGHGVPLDAVDLVRRHTVLCDPPAPFSVS